nr:PilZ domain-containing protein [uncultured Desulfobulbus sp.]
MDSARRQKYFVNHQDTVAIRCMACGKVSRFSVAGGRGGRHLLEMSCPCSETFVVDLEFRQDFRVPTHIPATFRAFATPKDRACSCVVVNRSSGGLLLHLDDDVPVQTNDRLIVCFRPHEGGGQEIERAITVRHFEHGRRIGGSFDDLSPSQSSRGPDIQPH